MEKRYTGLRTIGTIYKILGGLAGIITILVALGFCAFSLMAGASPSSLNRELAAAGLMGGVISGILGSVFVIIYGGGIALTLYAAGEAIYLLIALEENTRATMLAIQQRTP